ncbi:hypothetical protein Rsub_11708 [Raphidocelis subcapitata]|uniref:SprT-like domain-containing protein n=1 Tax=Raphidocelis subcapitata TaxID=307507 RepID=A0A2V0PGM9_9CHLO|nr:hypothetical protein Rsub_11708 [Raphidocelis subcapitata]|eukprot:GBF98916.1 hypothetical protein Rsub_11708 [Raphidocelis subcapitata]
MWFKAAGILVFSAAGAFALLWEERRRDRGGSSGGGGGGGRADASRGGKGPAQDGARGKAPAAAAARLAASLGPAAAAIPPSELRPLASLVAAVQSARGWRGGRYHFAAAWARVEARAASDAGGGWEAAFDVAAMTPPRVASLLALIDEELLAGLAAGSLLGGPWKSSGKKAARQRQGRQQQQRGDGGGGGADSALPAAEGALERQARRRDSSAQPALPVAATGALPSQTRAQPTAQSPPLAPSQGQGRFPLPVRVVDAPWQDFLAHTDDDGGLALNRPRWDKVIAPSAPVNCEGVVCTSRLQVLMHTLAHELVHALVLRAFPAIDAASPAYLQDDRHGPIFALLNAQLFGHSSTALARCDARAALGGGA